MTHPLDCDWDALRFAFFLYLVIHHRHDMPVIDNRSPITLPDDLSEDQPTVIQQDKPHVSRHRRRDSYFQPRKESKTSWQVKPARSHILVN